MDKQVQYEQVVFSASFKKKSLEKGASIDETRLGSF